MTSTPIPSRAAAAIAFSHDAINRLMIEAISIKIQDHEPTAELDLDPIEIFDCIASAADLPQPMRDCILLSADICPMHRCDAAICADDEIMECRELRDA
jgi:hypothetical protein